MSWIFYTGIALFWIIMLSARIWVTMEHKKENRKLLKSIHDIDVGDVK